jgi:sporulation transcriptional activator spo0A
MEHHLLIVDDNPRLCEALAEHFAQEGRFSVDICSNAEDALAFLANQEPDAALVDMLMPGVDGAEFMMQCRERKLGEHTKFIALSSLTSEEVIKLTQALGMAYFIAMPTPPERICRTVIRLLGVLREDGTAKQQKKTEKHCDIDCERIITNYLHIIGISPHVSGYRFLKVAIEYCVENYGRRISVTTEVYPEVARICKSTPKRVERNIRTAIDRAWFRGNIEMQHKMFGYTVNDNKGRPTNKECIAMLTDRTVMRKKYR